MLKSQIGFSITQSHSQNFDFIEIRKGTDHSQKSLRHNGFGRSINHNLCFYLVGITGAKKGKLSKVVWFQGTFPRIYLALPLTTDTNKTLIKENTLNMTISGRIIPFSISSLEDV